MSTQLSDHFTLEEAIISQTADRNRLNNIPPSAIVDVMKKSANSLERVRALLSHPLIVNSWYRSPEVNRLVGGVWNSQHLTGEAIDFICPAFGSPLDTCKKILEYPELISFDQLILEHSWVHISFSSIPDRPNKNQVLSLLKSGHYSVGLTDKEGNPL